MVKTDLSFRVSLNGVSCDLTRELQRNIILLSSFNCLFPSRVSVPVDLLGHDAFMMIFGVYTMPVHGIHTQILTGAYQLVWRYEKWRL